MRRCVHIPTCCTLCVCLLPCGARLGTRDCTRAQLHFDPRSQRLSLVSLTDLGRVQLSRGGRPFSGAAAGGAPSFVSVYSLFGPTFPGRFEVPADAGDECTYVLQVR
jgi:Uncharacterised protein family (UPF0183)